MVGQLTFFLGLQIRQLKDRTFFSQSKYAKELVKKFSLKSSKHSRTLISTTIKFRKDAFRKGVEQMLYRSIIRSLLYLIAHRSNILFNVGACARNQENPKELDLILVKRIIRYINGTLGYILWYPYDSSFMIVRYSNAD